MIIKRAGIKVKIKGIINSYKLISSPVTFLLKYLPKISITEIFMISEGWILNGPKDNHLLAPIPLSPKKRTTTSRKIFTP